MYKIFVNNKPLILTNLVNKEEGFKYFLLNTVNLDLVIRKLSNNNLSEVYLYHPDSSKLLSIFKQRLGCVNAGGGLVINDKNEILFIERNDKWDLPKGRQEKGESIELTSLREVEEETGVQNLLITNFLQETYHIYKNKGKYFLKVTYWYLMKTDYRGVLKPQAEEGITQAVWKTKDQAELAMGNSYSNVVLLTKAYLSNL
jgi:ADP-ribose pyrophosphatase YjhB (NUDIX family)